MSITFPCSKCGKPHKVDERFAGKRAACKGCGTVNRIPSAPAQQAGQGIVIPPASDDDDAPLPLQDLPEEPTYARGLLDPPVPEIEPPPPPPPPRRNTIQSAPVRAIPVNTCPGCGLVLPDGSFFCTSCGFNLKTGQRIAPTTVVADDAEEPDDYVPPLERDPSAALREVARWLIVAGVGVSLFGLLGLAGGAWATVGTVGPLLGALMALVASIIYFSDGNPRWGGIGAGATLLALIVLLVVGLRKDDEAAQRALAQQNAQPSQIPIIPPPATVPAGPPPEDPMPRVWRTGPNEFAFRKPRPELDPVEYYVSGLRDNDSGVRAFTVELLTKVAPAWRPEAADAMTEIANDSDPLVRRSVMGWIRMANTPKTVQAAIQGLRDTDNEVALMAIKRLTEYRDESAIDPLADAFQRFGDPVLSALASYGEGSRSRVTEAYRRIMNSGGGGPTRARVLEVMAANDPDNAGQILVSFVQDPEPEVRTTAMTKLGDMKFEPAFDAIANRLRDDPEAAAKALAKFGEPAEKLATAKLDEGDVQVRVGALRLLKELQAQKSLVAVRKAAQDPDRTVALAAREVWRRLAPEELTPVDEAVLDFEAVDRDVVVKALTAIKGMPVDPTRQPAVARRLFDVMIGPREQPIPGLARLALETWADGRVKDLAVLSIRPDLEDNRRAQAILLVSKFNDKRAVRPLCECLAAGRNTEIVVEALRGLGPESEEGLIRLFSTGDATMQATCCELWREIGTRRCFAALYPVSVSKTADEQTKKRAKETIIAITRRLNSQASATPKRPLPPPNFPTTRPLSS